MKIPNLILTFGFWLIFSQTAFAQTLDISAGGLPTVTGSSSSIITANSSTTQDLSVAVNLGDVSPMNSSNAVKITVPIAIRSIVPYQVSVSVNSSFDSNTRTLQASDIGFGVRNLRSTGAGAAVCAQSSHAFRTPFENDPINTITFNSNGRVKYASSIADVGVSSVILSGPRLSLDEANLQRKTDNAYIFDAIFVIKPQFYAPGNFNVNLLFTISDGPNAPC